MKLLKLRSFFVLAVLAGCGLAANALAQSTQYPPTIGPVPFTLSGTTASVSVPLNGQSYCSPSINSGATYGGGTVTFGVSNDNGATYYAVTGIPDAGSGANGTQSVVSGSNSYSVPVGGKTNFRLALTGGSAASISGNITCNAGANGGGGNSGGTFVVSPQPLGVFLSPSPAPWPTTSPGGIPLLTYSVPNSNARITSSSTTGCQSIYIGTGALYELINIDTAQTVALNLYDEAGSPSCAAADRIIGPILGVSQVIFFGPFGHPFTSGLAYGVTTASLVGAGILVDYNKQ